MELRVSLVEVGSSPEIHSSIAPPFPRPLPVPLPCPRPVPLPIRSFWALWIGLSQEVEVWCLKTCINE